MSVPLSVCSYAAYAGAAGRDFVSGGSHIISTFCLAKLLLRNLVKSCVGGEDRERGHGEGGKGVRSLHITPIICSSCSSSSSSLCRLHCRSSRFFASLCLFLRLFSSSLSLTLCRSLSLCLPVSRTFDKRLIAGRELRLRVSFPDLLTGNTLSNFNRMLNVRPDIIPFPFFLSLSFFFPLSHSSASAIYERQWQKAKE